MDFLVEVERTRGALWGFTHILAGFTQHLKRGLFPAKTCYFRPAIRNSRWLAGKSPCEKNGVERLHGNSVKQLLFKKITSMNFTSGFLILSASLEYTVWEFGKHFYATALQLSALSITLFAFHANLLIGLTCSTFLFLHLLSNNCGFAK